MVQRAVGTYSELFLGHKSPTQQAIEALLSNLDCKSQAAATADFL